MGGTSRSPRPITSQLDQNTTGSCPPTQADTGTDPWVRSPLPHPPCLLPPVPGGHIDILSTWGCAGRQRSVLRAQMGTVFPGLNLPRGLYKHLCLNPWIQGGDSRGNQTETMTSSSSQTISMSPRPHPGASVSPSVQGRGGRKM